MRLLRRSDEELRPEDQPPGDETQAEERGRLREWQPRLYVRFVLLLAMIAYVVALPSRSRTAGRFTSTSSSRRHASRWSG
jgi:hypothetical protein